MKDVVKENIERRKHKREQEKIKRKIKLKRIKLIKETIMYFTITLITIILSIKSFKMIISALIIFLYILGYTFYFDILPNF